MDKLIMENMAFYGYHGVLQEEKTIGQKFFIDAHLYLSLKKAGETDDLNFSVNYEEVYDTIRKVATNITSLKDWRRGFAVRYFYFIQPFKRCG